MNSNKKLFSRNEINLILAFFGFFLGILIFTFFTPNYYDQNEPVEIEIPKGATLNSVIDTLYSKDIINSKTFMKITAFLYGAETKIKHGTYEIPNGLSYVNLVELLIRGVQKEQILLTIPEGIWQKDLAELLHQKLGLSDDKFLQLSVNKPFISQLGIKSPSLEGYLLPETYYFHTGVKEVEVIKMLSSEMNKFLEKYRGRIEELEMSDNEVLTLASIIEGESNIVEEFAKISGVYHNRLKIGMALQADPTIQYLVRNKRKNKIYFKDLEIDSKYNTYKYAGLPPSPINNPGKDAIIAALYPEENNYYYFVADGTGGHIFAKNYAEHQKNVNEYRKWRRSQN